MQPDCSNFSVIRENLTLHLPQSEGQWLMEQLPKLAVTSQLNPTFGELSQRFEEQTANDFMLFWNSPGMKNLRENGLLML